MAVSHTLLVCVCELDVKVEGGVGAKRGYELIIGCSHFCGSVG